MDIRHTAAYSSATLPSVQRPRTAPNADSGTPRPSDAAGEAPRRAEAPKPSAEPRTASGEPERIQYPDGALSTRAQQALKAYLTQEHLAQQEHRAALNQALGVDYYV